MFGPYSAIMAALDEVIATNEEALQAEDNKKLWFDDLGLDEKTKIGDIPIDFEIQAALEHLKRLKFQNIGLRTKELFLQRVLDSKSVEDTFPTPQELAKLELALGKEKTKLRSIKAARAAAEKSLEDAASNIDRVAGERDMARAEIDRTISNVKAASRLEVVKTAVESGHESALEKLVRDVDELDSACCQHVTRELRKQKRTIEKEASVQSNRSEALRVEVEELEKEVSEMERESTSLQAQISKGDKENKNAEELRREWTLQEELAELLSALVGIRITDVRENGMTIEIHSSVCAKQPSTAKSSSPTHTLDIEFGLNELGDTIVAYMHLNPGDVNVSDIVEDMNLSLEKGVQKVFSRFMRLQEEQAVIASTSLMAEEP